MTFDPQSLDEAAGDPNIGTVTKDMLYKKGDAPKVGSASPIEFKRLIFHVVPSTEARAEEAAVKLKQAKDAYDSKPSKSSKTKYEKAWSKMVKAKSQLDFVAKKLEMMASYAADHGLKHASEKKKKEIQALIGKSVQTIGTAAAIGSALASAVGMPSSGSHLGVMSSALTDLIKTDEGFEDTASVKADFKKDKNYNPDYQKPDSQWQKVLGVKGPTPKAEPPKVTPKAGAKGGKPAPPKQKKAAGGSGAPVSQTGAPKISPGDEAKPEPKAPLTKDEKQKIKADIIKLMMDHAKSKGNLKFAASAIHSGLDKSWKDKVSKVEVTPLIHSAYDSVTPINMSDAEKGVMTTAIKKAAEDGAVTADDYEKIAVDTFVKSGVIPSVKDFLDVAHAVEQESAPIPKTMSQLSPQEKMQAIGAMKKAVFDNMVVPASGGFAVSFHEDLSQKVKAAVEKAGFKLTPATFASLLKNGMETWTANFDDLEDSKKKIFIDAAKAALKDQKKKTGDYDNAEGAVMAKVLSLGSKVFFGEDMEKIHGLALKDLKDEDAKPDVTGAVAKVVAAMASYNGKPIKMSMKWIKDTIIKDKLGSDPASFLANYNIVSDTSDKDYGSWAVKVLDSAKDLIEQKYDEKGIKGSLFGAWEGLLNNGHSPKKHAALYMSAANDTFDQEGPKSGAYEENLFVSAGTTKPTLINKAFKEWQNIYKDEISVLNASAAPTSPSPVASTATVSTTPVSGPVTPPAKPKTGYTESELTDDMKSDLAAFVKEDALPGLKESTAIARIRKKFKKKYGYSVSIKHVRPLVQGHLAGLKVPEPTDYSAMTEQILGMNEAQLKDFIKLTQPSGSPDMPTTFPYGKSQGASVLKDAEGNPVKAGIGYHAKSWAEGPEPGTAWMFKPGHDMVSSVEVVSNRVHQLLGIPVTQDVWIGDLDGESGSVQLFKTGNTLRKTGQENNAWDKGFARALQRMQVSSWLMSDHDDHGDNFIIRGEGELEPIDKGQSGKFFTSTGYKSTPAGKTHMLSSMWSPPTGAGVQEKSLSTTMLRRWEEGKDIDLNLMDNSFLSVIDRAEAIPSDIYKELWRPYAEAAFAKGELAKFSNNNSDKTVEGFLEAIDRRRRTIREDVINMYRASANRRALNLGVPYDQVAEEIGLDALENTVFGEIGSGQVMGDTFARAFAKAKKTKDVADIQAARNLVNGQLKKIKARKKKTKWDNIRITALEKYIKDLDEEFGKDIPETSKAPTMADLKKRGFLGSQMMVGSGAGHNDVRDAKMSLWRMGDSAFGTLNLSKPARAKIESVLAPYVSGAGTGTPLGPAQKRANKYRDLLLPPTARARIQAYVDHGVNSSLTPIRVARSNLEKWSKGDGIPAAVLKKDKKEFQKAAQHYYDYIKKIMTDTPTDAPQYAKYGGVKWEMDLALDKKDRVIGAEFEFDAEKKEKAAEKKKKKKPQKLPFKFRKFNFIPFFQGEAKGVEAGSGDLEISTDGKRYAHENYMYSGVPLGDKTTVPSGSYDFFGKYGFSGESYEIDLGDGVIAVYAPDANNRRSKRGVLKLKFGDKTKDGDIEKGLKKLEALGIDIAPATRDETEAAYLRKMAWMLRRAGSGENEDLHEMEPTGLSAAEVIEWYKDKLKKPPATKTTGFAKGGGQVVLAEEVLDESKNPNYDPIPVDFGGVLEWRRPDVDDATFKKLDDYVLYAGTKGGSKTNKKIGLSGSISWEMRSQRGLPVGGASNNADENTGGSHDVFLRLGRRSKVGNTPGDVQYSARRLGYTGWNFNPSDSYGNKFATSKTHQADVRQRYTDLNKLLTRADKHKVKTGAGGGEEVMVDGLIAPEHWGEGFSTSAADKKAIVAGLKKRGIKKIAQTGKKVEDLA